MPIVCHWILKHLLVFSSAALEDRGLPLTGSIRRRVQFGFKNSSVGADESDMM